MVTFFICQSWVINYELSIINYSSHGGLAQLARAPALQAGGQRFESVILHLSVGILVFRVSRFFFCGSCCPDILWNRSLTY